MIRLGLFGPKAIGEPLHYTSIHRSFLSILDSPKTSHSGSFDIRFAVCCFGLMAWLLLFGSPAQAEIKPGDILVVDTVGGTNQNGALFLVNPTTGQRTVLSDFGNAAQGTLGNGDLTGVAVGQDGQIVVSALFSGNPAFQGGALFKVDPVTGNRSLFSNFSQGSIRGYLYYGLGINSKGKVIANLDRGSDTPKPALVQVDPETDKRSIITDLSNPRQGDIPSGLRFITDLTLERSGRILIATDELSEEKPDSKIFRVAVSRTKCNTGLMKHVV